MSIRKFRAHIAPFSCVVSRSAHYRTCNDVTRARGIHSGLHELSTGPHTMPCSCIMTSSACFVHYGNARKKDEIWSRRRAAERCGSLWSSHRTVARTRDHTHARTHKDVGSALSRTRWRNAQLPANTDMCQLRDRRNNRYDRDTRSGELTTWTDATRRGISRVLLVAHWWTQLHAWRSSAVQHDEGRHRCNHQSWRTRNIWPSNPTHPLGSARYFTTSEHSSNWHRDLTNKVKR